jgi:hypothetical protein
MSRSIDRVRAPNHQTVRLSKGPHRSPDDGVCVMELASMLAGERFTDHPRSVCRVIGGFLRCYNDAIDQAQRQDLYAYASKVVGTRQGRAVTRARKELCLRWAAEREGRKPPRFNLLSYRLCHPVMAGQQAAGSALYPPRGAEAHRAALAFLDRLIDVGAPHTVHVLSEELVADRSSSTTTHPSGL